MFRKVRIFVLLLVLAFVALSALTDRTYTRSWNAPVQVALYPVNSDGSDASAAYIQTLSQRDLDELQDFFAAEAAQYQLKISQPFRFVWAPALATAPPLPPTHGSTLSIMAWSLKLRWFTWRTANPPGPTPIIKLFVLSHDPHITAVLSESTGLSKGLTGIAHVFASNDMRHTNLVVIAHELLHTLTATDKYDLATNQPVYPEGYADPQQSPRYPQAAAELMAGRIPVSSTQAEQAASLKQVLIGEQTAREIGWLKSGPKLGTGP